MVTDPKILPMLAKIKRKYFSNEFDKYIVAKTTSDENGCIVAGFKLTIKCLKLENYFNKRIYLINLVKIY